MICKPSCVTPIPQNDWINQCELSIRNGGIPRLTFLKCDSTLEFPYANGWENIENIKWALCNGHLFISAPVLGQKPKGSFQKKRLTSCSPEETISGTKTITFQDYNADKEDLVDYDFWAGISENKKFLKFGYITCDERWFQFNGNWDIEIDEVDEDTLEGNSYWDGTITMSTKDILKPILVPGILAALEEFTTANCYS